MAEPFIDGGYVEFSGLDRMAIIDPSDDEEVGSAPASGSAEVDHAVQSARAAFPAWRDTPAAKRGQILGKAAHAVLGDVEELAPLLTATRTSPRGSRRSTTSPGRPRTASPSEATRRR